MDHHPYLFLFLNDLKWSKMQRLKIYKKKKNVNITKPKGPTIRMETDFKVVQQTLRWMERRRGEQSAYSCWPSLRQSSSHLSPIPAVTARWSSSPATAHPALSPLPLFLFNFTFHLLRSHPVLQPLSEAK